MSSFWVAVLFLFITVYMTIVVISFGQELNCLKNLIKEFDKL
jgi:hypothetical protein